MIKLEREDFGTDLGKELFDRISQLCDDPKYLLEVFMSIKHDACKEKMKMLLDKGLTDVEKIRYIADIIRADILLHEEDYLDLISKSVEELEEIAYQLLLKRYERLKQKVKNERMRELAEQENFED